VANVEKRTTKDGKVRYRALIRLKGHPPQSATFERKTDAKKWVQQVEAAIREGRHFKTSEAKRHTVADLIDRYRLEILPRKPRSQELQDHQLLWWRDQIGDRALADVSPPMLVALRDKLANEIVPGGNRRSPGTVNRYLAALSHALTIGAREWEWLDDFPMRRVSKLKEPRGRVRYLLDDERERLLDACKKSRSPFLLPAVVIALSTGVRKNELLSLTWNDVDLEREVIVLQHTKNDRRRAIPLTGLALTMMRKVYDDRDDSCPFVFPGKSGDGPVDLRTPWVNALKRAGIEDFRFHDLRHSAASYLAMSGASLPEIAEVLGHKTYEMVKRYSHLSDQHTAGVIERMNRKVFEDEEA
jgi:integrase